MEELSDPPLVENAPPRDEASPATPDTLAPPLDEANLPALNETMTSPHESGPTTPADTSTPPSESSPTMLANTALPPEESSPSPSVEANTPPDAVSPQPSIEASALPAESSAPTPAEPTLSSDTAKPTTSPNQHAGAARRKPPLARRIGASIGVIGALLVVGGALLPTSSSGDYEDAALKHAPLILVALLLAPAAIILGISILTWFIRSPLWLIVLGCLMIILAVWVHWLVEALFAALACFDVCPAGGIHYGTGFWLPLVGFPLSGIGLITAAIASFRRRSRQPAPTT